MEIVVAYVLARWWLAHLSFPESVKAARRTRTTYRPALPTEQPTTTAIRLGRAVELTLRPLPFDSRCLVKALVLTRLLAKRSIESTFVLGVRAQPRFAAHAWVERDGVALLPTTSDFHRLSEL